MTFPPLGNAGAAGLDPHRLARLDQLLAGRYVEPRRLAGCQIAVMRHGVLAYLGSYGFADAERQVPVANDTIWRIYSMTKPVTGVAVLTLYERGLIGLTDPVEAYIPSWKDIRVRDGDRLVKPARPPQVRDLLTHTSGLGYARGGGDLDPSLITGASPSPAGEGLPSLEPLVDEMAQWPLRFQPGTRWLYSFGLDVCARIVELASGQRFDEYVDATILGPLGMVDTGFKVPARAAGRFAACYAPASGGGLVRSDDPLTSGYLREPGTLLGGSALVSTTPDYLRFCRTLLGGGALDGVRVLGSRTVELMCANHLPGGDTIGGLEIPNAHGVSFDDTGFGLSVAVNGPPALTGVAGSEGSIGWDGAASTFFWIDPQEELIVVFMTQLVQVADLDVRDRVKALVYAAIVDADRA